MRPAELVPALVGLPIYNYLILAAFAFASPRISDHLQPDRLTREPITACVLGLLVAVPLSHLVQFNILDAREKGFEFFKVSIYYVILISVVNSTSKLRIFLYTITLAATLNATIAILHFYEIIDVPSLSVLEYFEEKDPETGMPIMIRRLRATGIFNDPNDLSMIAVLGFIVAALGVGDKRLGPWRLAWLIPLGLLATTVVLTKSRGGLLAMGAAISVLSYVRFGIWKTTIPIALFLPVAAFALVGRGGAMAGGTGTSRTEIWSEGLLLLKQSPLFGIGAGNFAEEVRHVAHNSFVHTFTELGLFGGACFLGACWIAGLSLWKLGRPGQSAFKHIADPSLQRMRPYLLALLAGFVTSMMTLSRAYVIPPYMVFGIVNAYALEAQRQGIPTVVRLTPTRIAELVPLSVAFLAAVYVFILVSIR